MSKPQSPSLSKWVLVILLAACLFHVATVTGGHAWGDDFAQYILHGRNLAWGMPYAETGYLQNPVDSARLEVGPKMYPPGYPAFVAPVYSVYGLSYRAMKYEQVAVLLAGLIVILAYFQSYLGASSALAIVLALVLGLNPFLAEAKDYIGSDLLFLFLCFLTLWLAERLMASSGRTVALWLALGVAMYLACATRTVGIVLFAVVLLTSFVRRIRQSEAIFAVVVACVLLFIQGMLLPKDNSYVQFLLKEVSVRGAIANAIGYFKELSAVWSNPVSLAIGKGLYILTLPVVLFGVWMRRHDRLAVLNVFVLGYLAVIFIWPSFQGRRFLLPILPVYLFYLLAGTERLNRKAMYAVAGLLLVLYTARYVSMNRNPEISGVGQPEFLQLCGFIKSHTQPGERFLFSKPRALALVAERPAAIYNADTDEQRTWDLISRLNIHYLVVSNVAGEDFERDKTFVGPFVERHRDHFEKIYQTSKFAVYRILNNTPAPKV